MTYSCSSAAGVQPPSSSVARAAAHSPDRKAELRRHLADPRLNIDNNPCENVIRPLCLGGGTGSSWGAGAADA